MNEEKKTQKINNEDFLNEELMDDEGDLMRGVGDEVNSGDEDESEERDDFEVRFRLSPFLIGLSLFLVAFIFSVTISPLDFLRFRTDRIRNDNLKYLSRLVNYIDEKANYAIKGENGVVYVSLPDNDPNCGSWINKGLEKISSYYEYRCSSPENYRKVDGTGWLPIDFTVVRGLGVNELPIDPKNGKVAYNSDKQENQLFYYHYVRGSYNLGGRMQTKEMINTLKEEMTSQMLRIFSKLKKGEKFSMNETIGDGNRSGILGYFDELRVYLLAQIFEGEKNTDVVNKVNNRSNDVAFGVSVVGSDGSYVVASNVNEAIKPFFGGSKGDVMIESLNDVVSQVSKSLDVDENEVKSEIGNVGVMDDWVILSLRESVFDNMNNKVTTLSVDSNFNSIENNDVVDNISIDNKNSFDFGKIFLNEKIQIENVSEKNQDNKNSENSLKELPSKEVDVNSEIDVLDVNDKNDDVPPNPFL